MQCDTFGSPTLALMGLSPMLRRGLFATRCENSASFVRSGKPVAKAYIESFHGRFHDARLNEPEVRLNALRTHLAEEWRIEYTSSGLTARLATRLRPGDGRSMLGWGDWEPNQQR